MQLHGIHRFLLTGFGRLWAVLSILWIFGVGTYFFVTTPTKSQVSDQISEPWENFIDRLKKQRNKDFTDCSQEHSIESVNFKTCLEAIGYFRSFEEEKGYRRIQIENVNRKLDDRLLDARMEGLKLFAVLAVGGPLVLVFCIFSITWVYKGFKK